ncbi:alpha-L-rhamnosidase C-terminal domain-containing protein [Lysobacter korlensis]|uniref:Alpha-L-rhamnosidase C-terminal domain-containing protein n=1 Tax=Lysobacter korlensis TaxID=553636 RepID=A0ABV6RP24_9GAMM
MIETIAGPPAEAVAIREALRQWSPDPFPDQPEPRDEPAGRWLYHRGQFELGRLHRRVAEGFAANRFVHYAANYGALAPRVFFGRALSGAAGRITLCTSGTADVSVDGTLLAQRADGAARREADVPAGAAWLQIEVRAAAGEPAALLVRDGPVFETGSEWASSLDGTDWHPVSSRAGTELVAPHARREPVVTMAMELAEGIFELPVPVLGRPVIDCDGRPGVVSGESREEAADPNGVSESRHEVVLRPDGRWTTFHELGFRFLTVSGARVRSVSVEASAHPVARRGAFVCADPELNRIWAHSAFTLRSCMHELMLDGIKRDRMPWMGDQALNTLSNAYAFGEGDIIRDSIVALGSPRHGYVNGISDYSLWWLINTGSYFRLFGDTAHLIGEAEHIHRFTERLAGYQGPGALFRPANEPDSFTDATEGAVFLDWGATPQRGKDATALQVLWFWALRSAAELLDAAGHDGAARWAALADDVRSTLHREAWDARTGSWAEHLGPEGESPYPNFLAILSGLSAAPVPSGVVSAITAGEGRIGTPFMASFALRALVLAGEPAHAIAAIRTRWGAMLDAGAVTFWEEFPRPGGSPLAMYGRPYGKSLCHAWAAGPAALLPEAVLGIRPLSPGWRTFEVAPALGDLPWAAAVVPVPDGEIAVSVAADAVTVKVPSGAVLVRGSERWVGPCLVGWRGGASGTLLTDAPDAAEASEVARL